MYVTNQRHALLLLLTCLTPLLSFFFFFNDTATTEIYTLSLHDALPISVQPFQQVRGDVLEVHLDLVVGLRALDRKSTRLNSSHSQISYAVFCLKKKKKAILSRDGMIVSTIVLTRAMTF